MKAEVSADYPDKTDYQTGFRDTPDFTEGADWFAGFYVICEICVICGLLKLLESL
jgi:hypothetical protein